MCVCVDRTENLFGDDANMTTSKSEVGVDKHMPI